MARGKAKELGEILQRQTLALELRIKGLSYRAIADRLKCSHETVRLDIEGELKRLADLNIEKAAELRELELVRLDKIIYSLSNWVESGNVGAASVYIKASERRSKLLGLDAPTKHEVDWRAEAQEAGLNADDVAHEFEELVKIAATKLVGGSET